MLKNQTDDKLNQMNKKAYKNIDIWKNYFNL
jgi:hypothetical protein